MISSSSTFITILITWPLFWSLQTINIHCANNINHNDNVVDVNTLKFVILIHRHGDRTPIETYPRDPYRDGQKYWPDGWGQLTLDGKKRMYNLGLYLSKRYTFIRSSASDRCLESVSLVLAGLYPPNDRWKWNDNLGQKWQPFPIQTVPHDIDGMLNPQSKCKKAEQILADIYKSKSVIEYYNQMKSTLLYVQDNTGYENVNLIKAEEIFDSLLNEKLFGYKLPAWVDTNIYTKLKEISDKTFIFDAMTREIQKFRAGLLLADIWQHISNHELLDNDDDDDDNKHRLYIYSTHDDQLSVFMSALNNFNGIAPPYGSTIMMEIHQNHTDESFIRMYYLNVTEMENPYRLELKDCYYYIKQRQLIHGSNPDQCTITNFYETIKDLLPNDWNVECENSSSSTAADPLSIYLVLITISLTISVMLFFTYLLVNHRRYGSSYRLLPIINS
ncbi:lysosomal acid phosphatase-like protein [Dermatophagoides farinae]|uniref:Lysosomal acid phosphatase-like protein n=1 Tax=Dermatophagoides farinae TaxID=6954 RepID=A0A9D4P9C2_DERFA|nr:lysosomal acid phosphatase-like protein [Dermatophagoides farinae]